MSAGYERFQAIVRNVPSASVELNPESVMLHPFDVRDIHPDFPKKVRQLFDNGHYEDAVFNAFKYIETEVKRITRIRKKTGEQLMGDAFGGTPPKLMLNAGVSDADEEEQRGYQALFKGAVAAIRNPRGHDSNVVDYPDRALDYLAFASLLLRRLDAAGVR